MGLSCKSSWIQWTYFWVKQKFSNSSAWGVLLCMLENFPVCVSPLMQYERQETPEGTAWHVQRHMLLLHCHWPLLVSPRAYAPSFVLRLRGGHEFVCNDVLWMFSPWRLQEPFVTRGFRFAMPRLSTISWTFISYQHVRRLIHHFAVRRLIALPLLYTPHRPNVPHRLFCLLCSVR